MDAATAPATSRRAPRPFEGSPDTAGWMDRINSRPRTETKKKRLSGPLANIVSRSSECLCQQPCAACEKPDTCDTRNHTPGGNHLLGQHQDRDRGDPQHVHHSANEEQCHQDPAAADAIGAMTGTKRKRTQQVGAKSAVALNE